MTTERRTTTANSGLAKGGVSCFVETFVQGSTFVLRMNFSAKNPALRQAAKRYIQWLRSTCLPHINYFYLPTFEFYITAHMQAKRKNNFRSTPNLIT